jgi:hypothetical protein
MQERKALPISRAFLLRLSAFAGVFFPAARLGKVAVVLFQLFVLVAVSELAVDVRIVLVRLRLLLLDSSLGCVTIVLLQIAHAATDV